MFNYTEDIAVIRDMIENLFLEKGSFEGNIILFILIIFVSFLIAIIFAYFIDRHLRRLTSMTKSEIDDKIINILHKPIYYIIILLGIQLALTLFFDVNNIIFRFITAILILIFVWVTANILGIVLEDFGKRIAVKTKTTIDDEAIPFLSKILRISIYVIGIMIILDQFGIEITPLIASLGIAGFAIGFAAKDTISNILAGFFILLDRPFTKGDRIKVGDNIGDVVDIGLRSTKIRTLENTYVIIPNSDIVSQDVTNYALPDLQLKVKLTFGVAYGSDPDMVKRIILDIANKSEFVMDDPAPSIYFTEFADSSINFLLIFWVHTFRDRLRAMDDINEKVYKKFAEEGIEIPFPCRTVYLHKEK